MPMRIDIPCSTEAMMQPPAAGRSGHHFHYQFQSSLPTEAFEAVIKRLNVLRSEETPEGERIECTTTSSHTMDEFYQPGGDSTKRVRVTRDVIRGETQAVYKRKRACLDLYSGRRCGEHGLAFDLRIGLATETPVDFEPEGQPVVFCREKLRTSFHFKAWRIDMTTVIQKETDGQKRQTHEIELELDSWNLQRNLHAKLNGQQHKLWELLSDFLFAARDLAAFAAEQGAPPEVSPAEPVISEKVQADYLESFTGMPLPVIGHYLFRLAGIVRSRPPEPVPPSPPKKRRLEDAEAPKATEAPGLLSEDGLPPGFEDGLPPGFEDGLPPDFDQDDGMPPALEDPSGDEREKFAADVWEGGSEDPSDDWPDDD